MKRRPVRAEKSAPAEASADDQRRGTREQLLDAAGHVFAEKGFDRATGKEICERARTNTASINYYFGGMENLYAAVLTEARSRVFSATPHGQAGVEKLDAMAKLQMFIEGMMRAVTAPASSSWVMRVISREVVAPTPSLEGQRDKEFVPRANLLRGIVAELMDLPEDHQVVARGCVNILAPLCILLICDRKALKRGFAGFSLTAEDAPAIARHMALYAQAGLAAVARDARRSTG